MTFQAAGMGPEIGEVREVVFIFFLLAPRWPTEVNRGDRARLAPRYVRVENKGHLGYFAHLCPEGSTAAVFRATIGGRLRFARDHSAMLRRFQYPMGEIFKLFIFCFNGS